MFSYHQINLKNSICCLILTNYNEIIFNISGVYLVFLIHSTLAKLK
ncbi:hypothetical protein A1OE_50 [Candidatus Endolissoclinum faulkneri L2]|uniref:Uncharacterized protein n=1 Tax=Candidatus Endolissoclinum faulkneri L2 TaxID=1193729 RepID=K7YNR5_9PROT|nr:hypothetical protein A1OE_50 [Candidatus Endolissoclinum faulkneri L2]